MIFFLVPSVRGGVFLRPIKVGKEEHEALPEDELEQEQIVKQKRG